MQKCIKVIKLRHFKNQTQWRKEKCFIQPRLLCIYYYSKPIREACNFGL